MEETSEFFKWLLPDAELILSDAQQTAAGRRFWESRIGNAFSLGLFVYAVDQNLKQKIHLKTEEDFASIRDAFWGDQEKFKARRFAISKKQLWKD